MIRVAFFQPAGNFPALAALNIDTIAGPEPTGSDQAAFAASAKASGLNVVLKNPALPIPINCVGFLLTVDEPNEAKGVNPITPIATLKPNYDALRKMAPPGWPIYITIGGDRLTYDNWPNAVDKQWWLDLAALCPGVIPVIDHYSANKSNKYPMNATATGIARVHALTGLTCHAFQECTDQQLNPPALPETNGAPSPAQIAASASASFVSGAEGIWWFFTNLHVGWPLGYMPNKDRNGVSIQPLYDQVKAINAAMVPAPAPVPITLESVNAKVDKVLAAFAALKAALP